MRGDQQAPEPMPERGGRKDASVAYLSVLKPSDLPAEIFFYSPNGLSCIL